MSHINNLGTFALKKKAKFGARDIKEMSGSRCLISYNSCGGLLFVPV